MRPKGTSSTFQPLVIARAAGSAPTPLTMNSSFTIDSCRAFQRTRSLSAWITSDRGCSVLDAPQEVAPSKDAAAASSSRAPRTGAGMAA